MGWEDRQYANESSYRGGIGGGGGGGFIKTHFAGAPVVFWLMAINIAVFVLDLFLQRFMGSVILQIGMYRDSMPPLFFWGHFSALLAIQELQLWRFLSFQFIHGGPMHLLFNMFGLYFFGPMVESWMGSRRFIVFYLLCGIAGPIVYLALWAVGLLAGAVYTPLVGASAGIFGVLIGAAVIAPNVTVHLLFPPIPLKLKTLAWCLVGLGAFMVLFMGRTPESNAGGHAAHLGGAALGYYLMHNSHLLSLFSRGKMAPSRKSSEKSSRSKWNPFSSRHKSDRSENTFNSLNDQEVDRILDKVRDHGLASLTEKEKKMLNQATERKRGQG